MAPRNGAPPGEQLEQDRPQGIDIGRGADPVELPLGLLGGHVAGSAHDGARGRHFRAFLAGQAEIADLGDLLAAQEDIRRLQVAMDDSVFVSELHRLGQEMDQAARPPGVPGYFP